MILIFIAFSQESLSCGRNINCWITSQFAEVVTSTFCEWCSMFFIFSILLPFSILEVKDAWPLLMPIETVISAFLDCIMPRKLARLYSLVYRFSISSIICFGWGQRKYVFILPSTFQPLIIYEYIINSWKLMLIWVRIFLYFNLIFIF